MIVLGIDIGGTSAKCGLISGGRIIRSASCPTAKDSNYSKIVSDIVELCQSVVKDAKPEGAGIGSPGLIDSKSGIVCWSNNIRWQDRDLRADLERELGLPTKICNDAKCAALGEALYGAGKKKNSSLMLTLGTGVGGGFVKHGKLDSDTIHASADSIFGHITVEAKGRQCNCGRCGCLEAYSSARALIKQAQDVLGEELTAKEIFDAARADDPAMKALVDEFIFYLGVGVVSLANALRPEIIILGGGISSAVDMMLPEINKQLETSVFGYRYAPVQAVKAMLGADAGIVGAAALFKNAVTNEA